MLKKEKKKEETASAHLVIGARYFIEKNKERDCWRFGIRIFSTAVLSLSSYLIWDFNFCS
jgi:hypothetical protein